MWDKPRHLMVITHTLICLGFALLLYGTMHYLLHLPVFALRAVQLEAAPQHVDVNQIEVLVHNELRGNFFTVDLESTQLAFEKLPWVRKASIRRLFPWQLLVSLEEHVALAKWNDTELVNSYGEVFNAETSQILPSFNGQPDAATEVTRMYAIFAERLAPLRQQITQITLSPRRAWQLRLDNGMLLKLGSEQVQQRFLRFVAVYPRSLASMERIPAYVDLRYRSGFAIDYASLEQQGLGGGEIL